MILGAINKLINMNNKHENETELNNWIEWNWDHMWSHIHVHYFVFAIVIYMQSQSCMP